MPNDAAVTTEKLHGGGILSFLGEAGWVGRIVFVILVGFSFASWFVIFLKAIRFSRAHRTTERFLSVFRKSRRFSEVSSQTGELAASPLVGMFQAAYAELDSQVKTARAEEPAGAGDGRFRIRSLSGIERALRRSAARESRALARNLGILATTAAAAPFIGLFGTVWGIMKSFDAIGGTGSTSIVAVAPGIAEALVNTAAGLGAAIPALVAYNVMQGRIRELRGDMEDFGQEFLALAEKNFT